MAKERMEIYVESDTKNKLLNMANEVSNSAGVRVTLSQLCNKILREATSNDKG